MNEKQKKGSETALGGFKNEGFIAIKINNYMNDLDAQKWLKFMGYLELSKIQSVKALVIKAGTKDIDELVDEPQKEEFLRHKDFSKADIQVQIDIKVDDVIYRENISAKLVSNKNGFNQIDKRKVSKYATMWNMDDIVIGIMEAFTGEKDPAELGYNNDDIIISKGRGRITSKTMSKAHSDIVLDFLNKNKYKILSDIISGRGPLSASYMIINHLGSYEIIECIDIINYYCNENFKVGSKTTFILGDGTFSIQRKGGTPDPTSLQFKFKPTDIVKLKSRGYIR